MTSPTGSTSCECGHAERDHEVPDANSSPCRDSGCGCLHFREFSYRRPAPVHNNPALEYALVGVIFKHTAGKRYSMTFEEAQALAKELIDRLEVTEGTTLSFLTAGSDLTKIHEGVGFFGDIFQVLPLGSDRIVGSLRLKEVDS